MDGLLEKHYEELTSDILFGNVIPFANSMPIDQCFLRKKFKKTIKNAGLKITHFMNVIYEKPQNQIVQGTFMDWSLLGDISSVFVIDGTELFVKGKKYWVYCVGMV